MANVEHRDMVSADVHEPRHISDSTASDAGKVITPLSGGTSTLRNLTPAEVGVANHYLEWSILENPISATTTLNLIAATDTELYTEGEYTKIVATNIAGATSDINNGITFDSTTYDAVVALSGDYRLTFWTNCHAGTNNTKVGVKFTLNNLPVQVTHKHDLGSLDRVGLISGTDLINLTAGDKVGIAVALDKTTDLQIDDLKMTVELLREI